MAGLENQNYQLEKVQELKPQEQGTLDSINNFCKGKNYEEGKKNIHNPNTEMGKKFLTIKGKVQEKKTSLDTKNSSYTSSINISTPTVKTSAEQTTTSQEARVDNVGQEKGKIELIDKDQVTEITKKIKDNITDPNHFVQIVGRSDANKFVMGPTANAMIKDYNSLLTELRGTLSPDQQKNLTAPPKPENPTEEQTSNWLNVILAQARTLKTLQILKTNLGEETFATLMKKSNTRISFEPHQPTLEGTDRGASVICGKIERKGGGSTTKMETPIEKETLKEKEHFELYQSIQFTTPDGKTFYKMFKRAMMIENKPGKESTLIPKGRTPINSKRNSQGKIIPSNQETAGRAIKYPDRYGAPDMKAESKKDVTKESAVLERTITKHTDGSITTAEEYTTSFPSKIVLPQITYNLTPSETKNNFYDSTATDIIPYLEKTYPIKTPDNVRALLPKTSETIHP